MSTPEVAKMIAKRTALMEQTAEELKALQRIVDGVVACPDCGSRDVVPEDSRYQWHLWCTNCDKLSEDVETMALAVAAWADNAEWQKMGD